MIHGQRETGPICGGEVYDLVATNYRIDFGQGSILLTCSGVYNSFSQKQEERSN